MDGIQAGNTGKKGSEYQSGKNCEEEISRDKILM